ncbi:MAG: CRISPR-associated endonuclease Cas2 [Rhodospirillaceae bacterium]|nr:CRISPR-associated endonuclease Cas2 [Rhodospirillaceae bacterium]
MLSGYRLVWMMVLFDLPVTTKAERKAATKFRKFLLDQGFDMSQYSVYMRFCSGKEQVDAYTRRVSRNLPSTGKVHIVVITDRQYENIISFDGRKREQPWRNPEQFVLF